ncbi:MAG: hypothetical protein WCT05_16000, partial [Lentisphaeria bacterium]
EQVLVDNPNRDLEEFFLDVVRQAQEQSVDTAGAHSGGEIPAYLMQGEGVTTEARGKAVLDALRRPENAPAVAVKLVSDDETPQAVVDLKKLEELGAAPVKVEEPPAPDQQDIDAKAKEEANAKLAKLRGEK